VICKIENSTNESDGIIASDVLVTSTLSVLMIKLHPIKKYFQDSWYLRAYQKQALKNFHTILNSNGTDITRLISDCMSGLRRVLSDFWQCRPTDQRKISYGI
jgi:hypothetical protein